MATLSIQSLRDIQATFNTAIDSYITTVESNDATGSPEKANAWKKITDVASEIVNSSKNTFGEAIELGMQVSLYVAEASELQSTATMNDPSKAYSKSRGPHRD
jgi:hypothetical protein